MQWTLDDDPCKSRTTLVVRHESFVETLSLYVILDRHPVSERHVAIFNFLQCPDLAEATRRLLWPAAAWWCLGDGMHPA